MAIKRLKNIMQSLKDSRKKRRSITISSNKSGLKDGLILAMKMTDASKRAVKGTLMMAKIIERATKKIASGRTTINKKMVSKIRKHLKS